MESSSQNISGADWWEISDSLWLRKQKIVFVLWNSQIHSYFLFFTVKAGQYKRPY